MKSYFHKHSISKDGIQSQCKPCRKIYRRKYYEKNDDLEKNYRFENKDRIKQYYLENRDKIIACKKIYSINRYETDSNFQLTRNTGSQMYQAPKGISKSSQQ